MLAQHAHPVSSSATKRGEFVREVLLCQEVPPPPADVDASIPEPSEDAATLRERVAVHLEDPTCASCHLLTDPIGLGLEQFDGLGLYREIENGAVIDPSGDVDGIVFADAVGLGDALAAHTDFSWCMSETLMSYASGRRPHSGEQELTTWLHDRFGDEGYSFRELLRQVATSRAFRTAAEVTP